MESWEPPEFAPRPSEAAETLNILFAGLKDGEGSLGKFVKSDEAYNAMIEALNSITRFSGKMTDSEGSFAQILNDDGKLYTLLENTLGNLESLSNELKDGKGTLGRVLNDDSLYLELRDTIRQLRAAIEDFRELAPAATFGSIALGAF